MATAVVVGAVLLSIAPATRVAAATGTPVTYQGSAYAAGFAEPNVTKPQSKLWFADGSWWALMRTTSDGQVHIHELRPDHTWRDTGTVVDTRTSSTGDALWDGGHLYVASRQASTPVQVNRFSYAPGSRSWIQDAGFPVPVGTGGSESVTLDKDSTGRLWVSYARQSTVWVAHTTADDATWTAPFHPAVPDVAVTADDISSVIAFDGKIGVLWSDQGADAFYFAVHVDGEPDGSWTVETALSGFDMADDHINLKTVGGDDQGRVFAAIKTSQGDHAAPPGAMLVGVLSRSREGVWSVTPAGTVAEAMTRPIIMVDESSRELRFFATKSGKIITKRSPLSTISFPTGSGTPFVSMSGAVLNNASGTKQPVSDATGLVITANDKNTLRYYHAEQGVPFGPTDQAPPGLPGNLVGAASGPARVDLTWTAATDDVGVTGYTVYRDGVPVKTTAGESWTDDTVSPATTYSYTVTARDAAGNESAPTAPETVTTPSDSNPPATPDGLTASTGVGTVSLSWTPVTDGGGAVTYSVLRDSAPLTTTSTPSAVDSSTTPGQDYAYTVVARDPSGNESAPSAAVTVTGPPALRGSTAVANAVATTVVATLPTTAVGDVVVASITTRSAPAVTAPTGWQLVRRDASGSTMTQSVYVHVATAAEPASVTWRLKAARGATAILLAYDGIDAVSPVLASSGRSNAKGTTVLADGVVAEAGSVLVDLVGAAAQVSVEPPAGMTERREVASPDPLLYRLVAAAADSQLAATGSTGSRTATLSGPGVSVAQLVTLRVG